MWSPRIDMCPPCKNHWMENSSIQRWDKKERRLWTQAGNSNLHSKSRVYQLADDSFTVDLISEAYICWLQKSYAHAENPIALFCWVSKLKASYHYNTVDIRYQDNTVVSRNAWHALFFPLKIRSFHMTMHNQNLEAVLLDSWWPILIFYYSRIRQRDIWSKTVHSGGKKPMLKTSLFFKHRGNHCKLQCWDRKSKQR